MESQRANLNVTGEASSNVRHHIVDVPILDKPITLNQPVEMQASRASLPRYPQIFKVERVDATLNRDFLTAASSAFEFWLNEDDAEYDTL